VGISGPGKHEEFAADLVEAAIDVRATGVLVDADFGVPQSYDAKRTIPPEYPADAVAAWRALS